MYIYSYDCNVTGKNHFNPNKISVINAKIIIKSSQNISSVKDKIENKKKINYSKFHAFNPQKS